MDMEMEMEKAISAAADIYNLDPVQSTVCQY
jgi:hypothetical protein